MFKRLIKKQLFTYRTKNRLKLTTLIRKKELLLDKKNQLEQCLDRKNRYKFLKKILSLFQVKNNLLYFLAKKTQLNPLVA